MKTRILIFTFFLSLISLPCLAGDSPKSLAKDFADRVEAHDIKGVLALVDGSYKQVQLIGMHKNDTTRFMNELFCGSVSGSSNFRCVAFSEVKKCEVKKIGKFSENGSQAFAQVSFEITANNGETALVQLTMVKIVNSKKTLYRFAGAVG